ncbi:MAG: hypothetical protein KDD39_12715 [Bdellovibrionales bacterium]|nr:hypothetical protein [Bdellovibrionales bacterium]
MAEGRIKYYPISKTKTNNRLEQIVGFGSESSRSGEYVERIKRIMKKLKEISARVDKLANQF